MFSSFLITPSPNIRCNLSCFSEQKEPNENTQHGPRLLLFSPFGIIVLPFTVFLFLPLLN